MKTKLLYLLIAVLFGIGMNSQTVISLTGSGVGGWGVDTDLVTTDGITYTKSNIEILGTGGGSSEVKFREAHDWAVAYGFQTGQVGWPSGVGLATGSVSNIPAEPGFWNVTFNLTTKAYSFTPGINPNAVIKITGTALPTDLTMSTTNGEAYARESITFTGGTAKFIEFGTSNQWSSVDYPSGAGSQSGGLIPVPAGTFYVYFYKSTGNYSFDPTPVSIIGGFNGWSGDVDLITTDDVTFTLNYTFAANTNLKFRDNHNWNFNFGSTTNPPAFPSGQAVMANATDIAVPAGTYDITFNRSTLAYSFVDVLGVNSFKSANFKVYPNPTNANWNLTSTDSNPITSVQVVDILGKVVFSKTYASNEVHVDASNLLSGVYFARVSTESTTETIKLVKN